ncbi:unnamed protein product [Phaedon cochleariae]|uniref:Uncharacterized protein n=1 Tax=Phaedon cochleariae TaxID=80249 RepID=A0A9N9SN25_PHACE|nr:unnamed protein product [Phaedon cochleariae]
MDIPWDDYRNSESQGHPSSQKRQAPTKNPESPRKTLPTSRPCQRKTLSLCSEICLNETCPKKKIIEIPSKANEKAIQTMEICRDNHPVTRNIGVRTDRAKINFGCCGKAKCCCGKDTACSKIGGKGEEKSDPEKAVVGDTIESGKSQIWTTGVRDSNRHSGTLKGVFELECSGLKSCDANCKALHPASS